MKICGWSIDGFGVFRDSTVAELPDGLTVLHGANEAGKSTLLEFLRRVLFGVPESSNGASYRPAQGGRHRGRVVLAANGAEVVVERELDQRHPPIVRRRDGSPLDPTVLARLLGGADDRVFRSVFAFSIDDLRSLAALDAAGLRDALFSATLAGAGRSARATAAALRARAAARLGSEDPAAIGRVIAELNGLRPRLNAARRAALRYADERASARRLDAAIDAQRAALAARRGARMRDDALLRAWPAWEALQAARGELAGLEGASVSAEAEVRVRAARERLDGAVHGAATLRQEHLELERQLGAMPALDPSGTLSAEVDALASDLPVYRLQAAALPAARARLAEVEQVLGDRLRRAGDEWTPDHVRRWSHAALDRESVRDWQMRMRAAVERAQHAEWRAEGAAAADEAARRARDRAAAELAAAAPGPSPERVERQRHALASLRIAMEEMAARRAHGEATAQALRERERALRALDDQQDPAPPAYLATALEVAALGGVGGGLWAFGQGQIAMAVGLGVVTVGAAAASRWAVTRQRAFLRRDEERQFERRALRSEMESARRARDTEWHRAAELAEEVARLATSLDLSRAPSPAEVEVRERTLEMDALADAQSGVMRARLAELERQCDERQDEARMRAEELALAHAARERVEQDWTAWRVAHGFVADAAPGDVLERIAALDAAHMAMATYDRAAREVEDLEPQVAAWAARARRALANAGAALAGMTEAMVPDQLLALRVRLHEDAPVRARRVALEQALHEKGAQLARAEADVAEARIALAEALRSAGVRDEAELIRRRAIAEHRAALIAAIAEHERLAIERLGDAQAMAELATGMVDTWRERAAAADAEIAELEQQLYQLVAEQQQLRASCRALEESAEVPALEAEWAALMAELADTVREWRVLAAAEGLIEEAQASFERSRQPGVLRAASSTFAAVTGGRYERVIQDDGGQALLVVDREGRRKEVGHELSRGTAEQLYISLRLGLAEELVGRGMALPLVMDDVLVHFDPVRAQAMAEVLGTFARTHQVLFFTCSTATRDLLLQHGRADRLVEL